MRRSFGPGAGGPMGGGGGGGGGMIKTVHRAIRAGTGGRGSAQESFSHSTARTNTNHNSSSNSPTSRPTYKSSSSDNNSTTLSFSSNNHPSPFSSVNHPLAAAVPAPNWTNSTSRTCSEEYDWECVDGVNGLYDDFVFSTVPSIDEVHHAVSSLQQFLDPPTNSHESGSEFDWIEPSRNILQSPGSERVYDAFHLLQTEPSVKRMVVSLSSDKSVWDAVMNNEVVREFRDSIHEANKSISGSSDKVEPSDGSIPVSDVLHRIFINTKAKVMGIVEKITEMVNELFRSPRNEKNVKGEGAASEPFEKKLRSSFLLSVMVLLIIVISRASRS